MRGEGINSSEKREKGGKAPVENLFYVRRRKRGGKPMMARISPKGEGGRDSLEKSKREHQTTPLSRGKKEKERCAISITEGEERKKEKGLQRICACFLQRGKEKKRKKEENGGSHQFVGRERERGLRRRPPRGSLSPERKKKKKEQSVAIGERKKNKKKVEKIASAGRERKGRLLISAMGGGGRDVFIKGAFFRRQDRKKKKRSVSCFSILRLERDKAREGKGRNGEARRVIYHLSSGKEKERGKKHQLRLHIRRGMGGGLKKGEGGTGEGGLSKRERKRKSSFASF